VAGLPWLLPTAPLTGGPRSTAGDLHAAGRQGMAMANPYGITLDDASLRWAAAEGLPESVIARRQASRGRPAASLPCI